MEKYIHPSIHSGALFAVLNAATIIVDNGHLENLRELQIKTENQPHFIPQMYANWEYKMFMVNVQLLL